MKAYTTLACGIGLVVVLGLAGALGCRTTGQAGRSLVVCSYGGSYEEAQRKAVFEPFERQTGVRVREATYSGEFARLEAAARASDAPWDVVSTESSNVLRGADEGLLAPMDYGMIDRQQLLPGTTGEYGVAWCYWSTVIGYNTGVFPAGKPHPTTWKEFWDVKAFPGARALRRDPRGTLEFALLADGVKPQDLYPLDVDRAFRSLDRIRDHVAVWWVNGAEPAELLASGKVALASVWNGRAHTGAAAGGQVAVEWNQGMLDSDWWVIPCNSRHPELARQLIAFASTAGPQADNTKWIPYGPVNKRALERMPADVAAELPTSPANLAVQFTFDSRWWADNEAQVLKRWNAWLGER